MLNGLDEDTRELIRRAESFHHYKLLQHTVPMCLRALALNRLATQDKRYKAALSLLHREGRLRSLCLHALLRYAKRMRRLRNLQGYLRE